MRDMERDDERDVWGPDFYSGSGMSCQPYGNLKDIETCSSIAPTYVSDVTIEETTSSTTSTHVLTLFIQKCDS